MEKHDNSSPVGWEVVQLKHLGHCLRGVTYKGDSDLSSYDNEHTKRLLRSNNVQDAKVFTKDLQFVNATRVSEDQILRDDDILICMANGSRALVGKAGFFKISDGYEYTFGAFMGCFRTYTETSDPRFVFYLFQTGLYRNYINNLLAGSSINNISPSSIESLEFLVPVPAEQSIIANTLSCVDVLITRLEDLVTKKKNIKQAAMSELLTGKRRLPGYVGRLVTKKLGDICEINKGVQINKSKLSAAGAFPVWNGGISPSGYTEKWNTKENTVTISEGGNSCGFVNFCNQKFWCGGHCYAVDIVDEDIDQNFLYQELKYMQDQIMSLRVGSGLPNIQKKNLLNLEMIVPEEKAEQTGIAAVLEDMDREIKCLEKELTKYHDLEQGMQQQLLTGKIRLV